MVRVQPHSVSRYLHPDPDHLCFVGNCRKREFRRGMCTTHYQRCRRWHRAREPFTGRPSTSERFWPKVDKTPSCWLWTGATGNAGYPVFRGEGGVNVPAYRFAYEELVGPIPEGLELDHLCRTPLCVRPDHLEPVTHAENMARVAAHRARLRETSAA